jgi:hypothetical protein
VLGCDAYRLTSLTRLGLLIPETMATSGMIGPGDTTMVGKVLLGASGVLNFVSFPLLIAGATVGEFKYNEPVAGAPDGYRLDVVLFFTHYIQTVITPMGNTESRKDLPDCTVGHFRGAMALTIVGAILGLILGLPLLIVTAKLEKSILRFARPVALLFATIFVVIALILAFTLPCDDDPLVSALLPKAKPVAGFFLIVIGLVMLGIAAILHGIQAFFFANKTAAVGDTSNEANEDTELKKPQAAEAPKEEPKKSYAPTPGNPKDNGWTGTKEDDADVEAM